MKETSELRTKATLTQDIEVKTPYRKQRKKKKVYRWRKRK